MPRLDRYQEPKLADALAGDYVLGTMGAHARRRFSALKAERVYLQAAVSAWERRLNPLGIGVTAVAPHPRVWRRIQREIMADAPRRQRTSWWNSLSLWRTAACTAVLALAGVLVYQATMLPAPAPTPSYVAVLVNEEQAPMIVATATRQSRQVLIIKMRQPRAKADQDLELWAIPKADGAPVSMGVLSKGQETLMELDERVLRTIHKTSVLAISQEPEGGSPTGSPTGPVVYQGKLVSL